MAARLLVFCAFFGLLERETCLPGFKRHTYTLIHTPHSAVFSCSLAQRYFLEKHDWSHEVWLLSCRAQPVMGDCLHLFSVRFVQLKMMLVFYRVFMCDWVYMAP